jgi:plasmid stabilization system protein ParE
MADLGRFERFLAEHHPTLSTYVAQEIISTVARLAAFPYLGRPLGRRQDYRESPLRVLNATYVIRYRVRGEQVLILRVFHGREARPLA